MDVKKLVNQYRKALVDEFDKDNQRLTIILSTDNQLQTCNVTEKFACYRMLYLATAIMENFTLKLIEESNYNIDCAYICTKADINTQPGLNLEQHIKFTLDIRKDTGRLNLSKLPAVLDLIVEPTDFNDIQDDELLNWLLNIGSWRLYVFNNSYGAMDLKEAFKELRAEIIELN